MRSLRLQARRRALARKSQPPLDLGLPSLQKYEEFLLFKPPSPCCFVWQHEQSQTPLCMETGKAALS